MTLENVLTTVLSVPFLFGAATAIAFRKAIRALFGSLLGTAGDRAETGQANDD
jgi:hypothetical protein